MKNYLNMLVINHKHKPIPYGGDGQIRDDGEANYGFKLIKGNMGLLAKIPELKRDNELQKLVASINSPSTCLFSVGCASAPISDQQGHRIQDMLNSP